MYKSYKIIGKSFKVSSGLIIPSDFTPYTVGQEPQELIDALSYKTPEEVKRDLKSARDKALADNEYALSDGSVYQVRPSDLSNFDISIKGGVSKHWILKNDTTRLTTVAELGEIVTAGIAQAEAIWDAYALEVGNL